MPVLSPSWSYHTRECQDFPLLCVVCAVVCCFAICCQEVRDAPGTSSYLGFNLLSGAASLPHSHIPVALKAKPRTARGWAGWRQVPGPLVECWWVMLKAEPRVLSDTSKMSFSDRRRSQEKAPSSCQARGCPCLLPACGLCSHPSTWRTQQAFQPPATDHHCALPCRTSDHMPWLILVTNTKKRLLQSLHDPLLQVAVEYMQPCPAVPGLQSSVWGIYRPQRCNNVKHSCCPKKQPGRSQQGTSAEVKCWQGGRKQWENRKVGTASRAERTPSRVLHTEVPAAPWAHSTQPHAVSSPSLGEPIEQSTQQIMIMEGKCWLGVCRFRHTF